MAAPTLNRVVADFTCDATGNKTVQLKRLRRQDVIKEKSLYGRKFMGVERSTFLIDKAGKLRHEWRKVMVKGHAQDVLDAVKNC